MAGEASAGFMVALIGVLSERYEHGEPGVCLGSQTETYAKDMGMAGLASAWGDGQTEAGVPSQGGRGDTQLRRMSP